MINYSMQKDGKTHNKTTQPNILDALWDLVSDAAVGGATRETVYREQWTAAERRRERQWFSVCVWFFLG